MKESYSFLSPINVTEHRKNFECTNPLEEPVNILEIFEPILHYFEMFAAGRFFWFVIDFIVWKHVGGGGDIEKMTPLKLKDFIDGNPQKLHDVTHPHDLPEVLAFSNFWVKFYLGLPPERRPHVKMSLYFRIMNAEQNYYWVMVQYPHCILDKNDKYVYGLVVATDISHIKKDGKPMMSILDTYEDNHQRFFCTDEKITAHKSLHPLTLREIEILHYLARGYSSKQIASQLELSIKTIDNHRQNMLHKTFTKSSAELVNYCTNLGYL